jgi:hypothetical protein
MSMAIIVVDQYVFQCHDCNIESEAFETEQEAAVIQSIHTQIHHASAFR